LLLRLRPFLVFVLAFGAPRLAAAEPAVFGTAEATVGGGHDNNMFLQVSPDAAARQPRVTGWFGHAAPRLGLALSAGGWRFDLSYFGDYRGSEAAGHLILQQADLSIAFPKLGAFRPTLVGTAGRFDATRFPADHFLFAGGGMDLRVEVSDSFKVVGGYRAELRAFAERGGERDLVHLGELRFAYRPGPSVELGVGSAYLAVVPGRAMVMDDGNVQAIRFGPDTEVVWGRLTLGVSVWGGTIRIGDPARDWQIGGGLGALLRLGENVDLSAGAELTVAPWASELRAQDYTRRYFTMGLVVHTTARRSLVVRRPAEVKGLRPLIHKGRARFRMRSSGASSVTVIGSWDDWTVPGRTLWHTAEPGLWEAWVEVPPGTHRYRFLVDGQAVRPPDAPRYAQDDFGGEDAVLEVPREMAP
jgi:hypothetical protein